MYVRSTAVDDDASNWSPGWAGNRKPHSQAAAESLASSRRPTFSECSSLNQQAMDLIFVVSSGHGQTISLFIALGVTPVLFCQHVPKTLVLYCYLSLTLCPWPLSNVFYLLQDWCHGHLCLSGPIDGTSLVHSNALSCHYRYPTAQVPVQVPFQVLIQCSSTSVHVVCD